METRTKMAMKMEVLAEKMEKKHGFIRLSHWSMAMLHI